MARTEILSTVLGSTRSVFDMSRGMTIFYEYLSFFAPQQVQ